MLNFPTWVIVMFLWGWIPEGHPWKHRKRFTIKEWDEGATELNCSFSMTFWMGAIFLVVITLVNFEELRQWL